MNVNSIDYRVAEELKIFAHPIRLRILLALVDEPSLNVAALTERLGVEQSVTSIYLTKMKDRGLLVADRQGSFTYYSLKNPAVITKLMQILNLQG
ncbi:ArsR/SmtB family transcription factor [Spirosoma sp.]|uniref:ArsR/SmtB family transcription factor n=1 Tax=Spirosoma sp. TaxID=1899569 RepID=UPI003B3A1E97